MRTNTIFLTLVVSLTACTEQQDIRVITLMADQTSVLTGADPIDITIQQAHDLSNVRWVLQPNIGGLSDTLGGLARYSPPSEILSPTIVNIRATGIRAGKTVNGNILIQVNPNPRLSFNDKEVYTYAKSVPTRIGFNLLDTKEKINWSLNPNIGKLSTVDGALFYTPPDVIEEDQTITLSGSFGILQSTLPIKISPERVLKLNFSSEEGDYIGQGKTYSKLYRNATTQDFTSSASNPIGGIPSVLEVSVFGELNLALSSRKTNKGLVIGEYRNAQRWPFESPGEFGLNFDFDHRGCNKVLGDFTIRDLKTSTSSSGVFIISLLDVEFVQYCDKTTSKLNGRMYYGPISKLTF